MDDGEGEAPIAGTLMDDGEAENARGWNLPDELTKLILVRLPANDLICYKLVSKLWLSLISSSDFISGHLSRCKSDLSSHLLLFHLHPVYPLDWFEPVYFRSVVNFLSHEVAIVGSVNGLLCVVSISQPRRCNDVWILNPVTLHIRKLPLPPKYPNDEGTPYLDPGMGKGYFAFWSDSNGEYKVAKIAPKKVYINHSFVMTTVAFVWVSSSPDTWSEIHVGFDGAYYHPTDLVSGCDVVIGDFAYWIVLKGQDHSGPRDLFVLSLNLKTLSLSLYEKPFPLHVNGHFSRDSLFEAMACRQNYVMFAANWNGEFVLVERVPTTYDVWTMDAVEGWSKKCSFAYPILKWVNDVNGKLVIMVTVEPLECGLAFYDIVTGEAEVIEDFILGHFTSSAHDFVGSLESIEGFKPIDAADGMIPQDFRIFWPCTFACRMIGKYKSMSKAEFVDALKKERKISK